MSERDDAPGLSDDVLAQVLDLELFKGLPPGAKRAVARFARFDFVPMGTEFVQQGDFTADFHVVLSGLVSAYRTEPDGEVAQLDQLGAGDWFGELSALSNQPSLARLRADTECALLSLDSALFKDVYKTTPGFKRTVDERYRERSLAAHLAVVPALRGLERRHVRRLRRLAHFETYEPGQAIVEPGAPIDALYLVRSGSVTFHRAAGDGSESLSAYLMENSSFGERAFCDPGATWAGAYRALTRADVLVLPAAAVIELFGPEPAVLEALVQAASRVVREDQGEALHEDALEVMVHRQSAKGGEALVIDLEKCVRCNACVESCVAVHDDGVPRLSKRGHRVPAEANALGKEISLVTSCYHCQTPSCMMSCSYGAIRRDPQGAIRFIWDNCVGCAMCVAACPYDVIRLTEPPEETAEQDSRLARLPLIGGLFARKEPTRLGRGQDHGFRKDVEVKGKAIKCDRCEGLPFEACVYNCPCGAIERRSPQDLFGTEPSQGARR